MHTSLESQTDMKFFFNNFVFRITGCDPSNGGFRPGLAKHLSYKDAKVVDIIHTDIGVRGAPDMGSINFYPNGGVFNQPGCKIVALNEDSMF